MIFRLRPYRFHFRAKESVYFPPGKAGNILRGALGPTLSQLQPAQAASPAGFAQPPRPWVFRAASLDARRFEAGENFSFAMNIFDPRAALVEIFTGVFSSWASTGLGPRRARVELSNVEPSAAVALELTPRLAATRCTVVFRTPTDLKGAPHRETVPFPLLFARVRDRLSALQTFYGDSPFTLDFRAMAARASLVSTVRSDLRRNTISRRSSRTGQTHDIGGLTGSADYAGELSEFLPWLQAAWWTGVGRHTVWGNGEIEVSRFE